MEWADYLRLFHTARPGITEAVLARGSDTAYQWLAETIPDGATVLDLGCGSAPLWPILTTPPVRYLGLDTARAELAGARARGAPVLHASAAAIPLAAGHIDVVACSMSLHVLAPLPAVLAEIRRVLIPGGHLVATIPARHPLRSTDRPIAGGLLAALGRRLTYPNDPALRDLASHLHHAGLRLSIDRHRRFGYRLHTRADADQLLASLYLPDLPATRYRTARRYLHTLARLRTEFPIPIRRITATTADPPQPSG